MQLSTHGNAFRGGSLCFKVYKLFVSCFSKILVLCESADALFALHQQFFVLVWVGGLVRVPVVYIWQTVLVSHLNLFLINYYLIKCWTKTLNKI